MKNNPAKEISAFGKVKNLKYIDIMFDISSKVRYTGVTEAYPMGGFYSMFDNEGNVTRIPSDKIVKVEEFYEWE